MSINITIDVSDTLGKLNTMINNLHGVNNVIEQDTDLMMQVIVDVAKELVPVDTGALKESIRFEGSFPSYRVVADAQNMYSDAFYGQFVEFGTSKMKAQPFIWPAINTTLREFKSILAQHVKEYLKG
jgi:HK97 gp10 family phage protein